MTHITTLQGVLLTSIEELMRVLLYFRLLCSHLLLICLKFYCFPIFHFIIAYYSAWHTGKAQFQIIFLKHYCLSHSLGIILKHSPFQKFLLRYFRIYVLFHLLYKFINFVVSKPWCFADKFISHIFFLSLLMCTVFNILRKLHAYIHA